MGIGDDAAILQPAAGEQLLVAKDMLLEGVHFDLSYTPLQHLGYKAIAVNVSDIAAMNGKPSQVLVGLGLSNRFSVEAIDELWSGMQIACKNYNVDLVGGDTTTSQSGLVISVTAIGSAPSNKIVKRSGAKPGDILCTTGDLGSAYLGLQLLEREKMIWKETPGVEPQLDGKDYLIGRLLKPEARMDVIYELEDYGVVPTSMIDISDGLASEVLHLCKQSNVSMAIYEEALPMDDIMRVTAVELNLDPTTCVLNGGEDYELLFTITPEDEKKLENLYEIVPIGVVSKQQPDIETSAILVTKEGSPYPIQAQGWNHLSE